MSGLSRTERKRLIQALLERERRDPGPPEAVRADVSERVEVTLGADVGNAQVLARQIARRPRPSLALVPRVAKPALASLLAYAPIALASLGAVTVAGGVAYLSVPVELKERLLGASTLVATRKQQSPGGRLARGYPDCPPQPTDAGGG